MGSDIFDKITPMTHIYVVLDTLWPYREVVDYLNYVLQRLNINPQASSVTLLSGAEARIMVNTTHYLTDLYQGWNVTTHSSYKTGFHLPRILSKVRDLVEHRMATEISSFLSGGSSLVALLMPSPMATIVDQDLEYCIRFVNGLNRTAPDLHFIYYAGGAVVRFKGLVSNARTDLFSLNVDATKAKEASGPVVERIRRIPRRIVNPRCSLSWQTNSTGHNRLLQYTRPGSINFYRLEANYFYGNGDEHRLLSVQAVNPVTFTVCVSRSTMWPHRNSSISSSAAAASSQRCEQLTTNVYSMDLSHACREYDSVVDCPPVYLSVQAQSFIADGQIVCSEKECQAPDQAMYAVQLQNMDCHGGTEALNGLSGAILATWALLQLWLFQDSIFNVVTRKE